MRDRIKISPRLADYLGWVRRLVLHVDKHEPPLFDKPTKRSAADEHLGRPLGQKYLALVYLQLSAASRHLAGTAVLGRNMQATASGATARASLEAQLWLEWLLAGRSAEQREARAAALLHHEVTRAAPRSELVDLDQEGFERFLAQAGVVRNGHQFNGERKPKLTGKAGMPGLLATSTLLPSEWGRDLTLLYAQLSALAHGESWRLLLHHSEEGYRGDLHLFQALRTCIATYVEVVTRLHRHLTGDDLKNQPWFGTMLEQEGLLLRRMR